MNKIEVDMIISLLMSLIKLLEGSSPALAKNPIILELEKALVAIQGLGL